MTDQAELFNREPARTRLIRAKRGKGEQFRVKVQALLEAWQTKGHVKAKEERS